MPVYLRILDIYEHELTMRWILKYGEDNLREVAMKEAKLKEDQLFKEARINARTREESELVIAARLGKV